MSCVCRVEEMLTINCSWSMKVAIPARTRFLNPRTVPLELTILCSRNVSGSRTFRLPTNVTEISSIAMCPSCENSFMWNSFTGSFCGFFSTLGGLSFDLKEGLCCPLGITPFDSGRGGFGGGGGGPGGGPCPLVSPLPISSLAVLLTWSRWISPSL